MKNFGWDYKFNLLKKYIDDNNKLPDDDYEIENIRIGDWFRRQLYYIKDSNKDENGNYRYRTNFVTKYQASQLLDLVTSYIKYERLSFEDTVKLCKEYISNTGNNIIKQGTVYKKVNIGIWLYNIKRVIMLGKKDENGNIVFKNSKVTKEQLDLLNELGVDLKKSNRMSIWMKKYELTCEYIKNNNGNLPEVNTYYKNVNIGSFVGVLRTTYNNGKKLEDGSIRYATNLITKEQLDLLEKIDLFRDKEKGSRFSNELWEDNLNEFLEYLKNNNDEYPSAIDNPALFNWVNTQRIMKKRIVSDPAIINSKFFEEYKKRMKILDSHNFLWNQQKNEDKWEHNFNLLVKYLKEHQNTYPPYNKYIDGVNLGDWIILQRTIFHNGVEQEDGTIKYKSWTLNKDRIKKLESINFIWIKKRKMYSSSIIKTSNDYECKKRLLLLKLERLLLEEKKEINSKKDIESINKRFIKEL